ncbi:MAG: NAD(+)/NADH kinase [Oscillospiraceae bacterium]|jgi:NAD+ kinase|nr:NAD(+)/NADH kinase [Oscillospiraceae bacterium]
MKTIAMVVNQTKNGAQALANEVCRRLGAVGIACLQPDGNTDCLQKSDALIAIGGDGTILSAARKAKPFDLPVLGINAGRLGFLAGLEAHELDLLSALAQNNFSLDTRMMLRVEIFDGQKRVFQDDCINDAVISRHAFSHLVELEVQCGERALLYKGDGVIFATPTGSTAYSFSAGGPVLDPAIRCVSLTPICNHHLFSRAIVFTPQTSFCTQITQDGLALTIDAETPLPLLVGQYVRVTTSSNVARFIRMKQDCFLDAMNAKLFM